MTMNLNINLGTLEVGDWGTTVEEILMDEVTAAVRSYIKAMIKEALDDRKLELRKAIETYMAKGLSNLPSHEDLLRTMYKK